MPQPWPAYAPTHAILQTNPKKQSSKSRGAQEAEAYHVKLLLGGSWVVISGAISP